MKKVIVANRGEIASRAIWSLRSLGIETIAVYSKEDRSLPFLNNADYAYEIGSGAASKTYENIDAILDIKKQTGADAVYIGYGFLYDSKELIDKANLIAPKEDFIDIVKDKFELRKRLKQLLEKHNIKTIESVKLKDFQDLEKAIKDNKVKHHEQTVIIKPNTGKYAKAIFIIEKSKIKETQLSGSQMEASILGFDTTDFILEEYLQDYKEISVLALRDKTGNITVLPEVDTTIAKSFSWQIAETPSLISDKVREKIFESVKEIAEKLNLVGLMNLEFFVKEETIYFNEINSGLSVWYSLVEQVSQIDIIKEQVRIFNGEELKHNKVLKPRGNAIMFKVFAENPVDATPSFGTVDDIFIPIIPNIRVEYTAFPAWKIPIHYDNMLGKISLWSNTREEMLNAAKYLLEKHLLSGVETNVSRLSQIIKTKDFSEGKYSISSFDKLKYNSEENTDELLAMLAAIKKLNEKKKFTNTKRNTAWDMSYMGRWKEGL